MRTIAQRKIEYQDALPSQAEGGYPLHLPSTLLGALRAWEQRRYGKSNHSWGHPKPKTGKPTKPPASD